MNNPTDLNFKVVIQGETDNYSQVVIEPLHPGFGQTIGNSLRRVMLTYLTGAAVTAVQVEGVQHQFTSLKGMRQDIVDLILNLKQLHIIYNGDEAVSLKLKAKGPGTVTAESIEVPSGVEIVNKDLVLADLSDEKSKLEVTLTVESGVGYSPAEERSINTVGVIPVDAAFSPVIRVNYEVLSTRVGRLTNFDKLVLEVWTNGTVKPSEAITKSAAILQSYFSRIVNPVVEESNETEEVTEDASSDHPKEALQLTVEELELPTRIANALRKAGLGTVKELLSAPQEEIMKVKNLGGKSINIIQDALKAKGIDMA